MYVNLRSTASIDESREDVGQSRCNLKSTLPARKSVLGYAAVYENLDGLRSSRRSAVRPKSRLLAVNGQLGSYVLTRPPTTLSRSRLLGSFQKPNSQYESPDSRSLTVHENFCKSASFPLHAISSPRSGGTGHRSYGVPPLTHADFRGAESGLTGTAHSHGAQRSGIGPIRVLSNLWPPFSSARYVSFPSATNRPIFQTLG
jgi:hypothetical protein